MQFFTAIALSLVSSVLAAPTIPLVTKSIISTSEGLTKRADLGVYLCNDRGFTGYCVHITAPSGVCVPLASDLEDKVSAVGPDDNAFCYFFV